MATIRDEVKTLLSGDATLSALLPGGWFDETNNPFTGMNLDNVPRLADGVRINPFGVISWKPTTGIRHAANPERGDIEMYCYTDLDYETLDDCITRLKNLLHRQFIFTASNRRMVHFDCSHVSAAIPDPDVGSATMQFIRFSVMQTRK